MGNERVSKQNGVETLYGDCNTLITLIIIIIIIIYPRKNEGGKKLRKIQRSLKWKN